MRMPVVGATEGDGGAGRAHGTEIPVKGGRPLHRTSARLRSSITAAQDRLTETRIAGGRYPTARSEEHTSELQSLMRISYAVFCLKKNTYNTMLLKPLHS